MIRTKEEILKKMKEKFGEDTDDTVLEIIEDVSDTISDYEGKITDKTDWKSKYEENDKAWRQKYRDRFFNGGTQDEEKDDDREKDKPLTFESLFEEKGVK